MYPIPTTRFRRKGPAYRPAFQFMAPMLILIGMVCQILLSFFPPERPAWPDLPIGVSPAGNGTSAFIRDDRADAYASQVEGYFIYINLAKLYLLVYHDGEQIRAFPCSGGKPTTPSPYGRWKIISKSTWGEGFGGFWLGLNVPWGKYGIHGTTKPWFIGRENVSKGCIRLYTEDARDLYELVPYGTPVLIQNDDRVFRVLRSGMIGSDVQEMQRALKKLKLYHGALDGKYGRAMLNSVKRFQEINGLPVTGVINWETYDAIMRRYQETDDFYLR